MSTERGVLEVAMRCLSLPLLFSFASRLVGEAPGVLSHLLGPGPEQGQGPWLAGIGLGLAPLALLAWLMGTKSRALARWILPGDGSPLDRSGPAGRRGALRAGLRVLGLCYLYSAALWFATNVLPATGLEDMAAFGAPFWAGMATAILLALHMVFGGGLFLRLADPKRSGGEEESS